LYRVDAEQVRVKNRSIRFSSARSEIRPEFYADKKFLALAELSRFVWESGPLLMPVQSALNRDSNFVFADSLAAFSFRFDAASRKTK
jgi:hypothetical protein